MIESAEEFVRLRTSEEPAEYRRSAWEEAPENVWLDVIERYPDMREWVAFNKTIPDVIMERLSLDGNPRVRHWLTRKHKTPAHILRLLADDPDDGIRAGVARHKNTPMDVVQALAEGADEWVANIAKERLAKA